MTEPTRFKVGLAGGLVTDSAGDWISYRTHQAEIERLRDWQRRAVQSMRWHAHCEVCAALVAEVGAP